MSFNDSVIKLEEFESNYLQLSTGFLIRPVQPQPQGKFRNSPLDNQWLAKPFMVGNVPLLLPTIADLPIEFPCGKIGGILRTSEPSVKLIIASIEVQQVSNISEEIAGRTAISTLFNGTANQASIYGYLRQTWPDLNTDSWVWLIQTIPAQFSSIFDT